MRKNFISIVGIAMFLCFWQTNAEAARAFSITQNPAAGSQLNMRSTQTVTFTITNTNTAGSTDRIYMVRFRLNGTCGSAPCTATAFSNATVAPPNWTRTALSNTSVTFRANCWAYAIAAPPPGGTLDFPIVFTMGNMTVDFTETLRDVRASFTTTSAPPFSYNAACAALRNATSSGTVTITPPASWKSMSLSASFQITDMFGVPMTSIPAPNGFKLIMTVTNNSSVTQNGIVSNPSPPTPTTTGTVTLNPSAPVYSPNPLNLAVLGTGTITYTYNPTGAADAGTVKFAAFATRGGVAISSSTTSGVLSIGQFIASLSTSTCAYNAQNITITMQLTNKFANNIVNVAPVLNPSVGAPVIYVAGPNPASPNGPVPSSGGTFNFTWTYQISAGAPGQTFTFVGSANGTEQTAPYPPGTPRATGNSTTAAIQVGGYAVTLNPTTGTNAKSAYEELIWSFTNQGCTPTNSVSIAGSIPAGWTWTGGDSYSLVNGLESWTVGGANPPVVFTATGPVDQLPLTQSGEYHLVYPNTPAATGLYTFNVSITDTAAHTEIVPTAITVNPYDPGDPAGLNGTGTGVWHEDVK